MKIFASRYCNLPVLKGIPAAYSSRDLTFGIIACSVSREDGATGENNSDVRIGSHYLQKEEINMIDRLLNGFLSTEKPFLRHGYTLKELAEDIDISLHHLSAFINQHYGMNFNDLINQYRVNHSIKKIINGEWKYKTLEAIANESGFNNRNTFRMAFKKVTGLSPSEYLKSTGRSL